MESGRRAFGVTVVIGVLDELEDKVRRACVQFLRQPVYGALEASTHLLERGACARIEALVRVEADAKALPDVCTQLAARALRVS